MRRPSPGGRAGVAVTGRLRGGRAVRHRGNPMRNGLKLPASLGQDPEQIFPRGRALPYRTCPWYIRRVSKSHLRRVYLARARQLSPGARATLLETPLISKGDAIRGSPAPPLRPLRSRPERAPQRPGKHPRRGARVTGGCRRPADRGSFGAPLRPGRNCRPSGPASPGRPSIAALTSAKPTLRYDL